MSLPPPVVHIKRKREDEAPPETLHIEHLDDNRQLKRRTTTAGKGAWVFQRVPQGTVQKENETKKSTSAPNPWEKKVPVIRATQPGDELRRIPLSRTAAHSGKSISSPNAIHSVPPVASMTSDPPRRFHLARTTRTPQVPSTTNGIRKARAVATFMERNKMSSRAIKELFEVQQARHEMGTQIQKEVLEQVKIHTPTGSPPRALKRPGRNARQVSKQAPSALIGGAMDDVAAEKLAAEMQKFTLETMASDPAEHKIKPGLDPSSNNLPARKPGVQFKPKAPAKRYHERHANETIPSMPMPTNLSNVAQVEDDDTDSDEEHDYITDTYVRVPAHTLELVSTDVGLLVIENDEQMEKFYEYGEDDSDDSDIFDDEIDENAEGNPNNEYPDEEVDSDDEFGRNPYKYRDNASDDEEFDLSDSKADDEEFDFDEAKFSDDGNDLQWTGVAWGKRKQPAWEEDS